MLEIFLPTRGAYNTWDASASEGASSACDASVYEGTSGVSNAFAYVGISGAWDAFAHEGCALGGWDDFAHRGCIICLGYFTHEGCIGCLRCFSRGHIGHLGCFWPGGAHRCLKCFCPQGVHGVLEMLLSMRGASDVWDASVDEGALVVLDAWDAFALRGESSVWDASAHEGASSVWGVSSHEGCIRCLKCFYSWGAHRALGMFLLIKGTLGAWDAFAHEGALSARDTYAHEGCIGHLRRLCPRGAHRMLGMFLPRGVHRMLEIFFLERRVDPTSCFSSNLIIGWWRIWHESLANCSPLSLSLLFASTLVKREKWRSRWKTSTTILKLHSRLHPIRRRKMEMQGMKLRVARQGVTFALRMKMHFVLKKKFRR